MAFIAEHVKKFTDDLRQTAAARADALKAVRLEVARLRGDARALVTKARQTIAAESGRQNSARADQRAARVAEVGRLLSGFVQARAERGTTLREKHTADRAGRTAAVAALRARARAIREEFAADRQLAAKVWQDHRAEVR